MVRHSTLTAVFVGSNPTSPVCSHFLVPIRMMGKSSFHDRIARAVKNCQKVRAVYGLVAVVPVAYLYT